MRIALKLVPALSLVLCLLIARHAVAEETIRILVMDDLARLSLHFPTEYKIEDRTGMGLVSREEGSEGSTVVLDKDNPSDSGIQIHADDAVIRINEFALRGKVTIKRNEKGLFRVINEIGLEDYTRAVVGEEMSQKWPIEALKAQAVIARTYALFRKTKTGNGDYDLCSSVNSQMFTGDAGEKEGPALAARATEGEVLSYGGELVETLYHSTCGGITEDAGDVWDWSLPYLKPRECRCCKESPYSSWQRALTVNDLEKALADNGYRTAGITSIKVIERSDTGRAKLVRVRAAVGGATLKGMEFRRVIGYARLPSTNFLVKREGDGFVFTGKGSGHGVGLCQWGAKVMAGEGKGYREILAYYYPGTALYRVVSGEGR